MKSVLFTSKYKNVFFSFTPFINSNNFLKLLIFCFFGLFLLPSVLKAQCSITTGPNSETIAAGTDDASQLVASPFTTTTTATTLALMSTANQVGLRFTSLSIPKGATIISAYVEFTAAATASTTTSAINIKGEAIGTSPTFAATASNISARTRTTSSVSWTPGSWTSGTAYKTSSITSVLQEIVNRSDWATGNNLGLFFEATSGSNTRTAHSFEGTGVEPKLVVSWLMVTPSVSGCYLSGGVSKATVSVEVGWGNAPAGETILVTRPAGSVPATRTITLGTFSVNYGYSQTGNQVIVSPQVVAFEIPANGATGLSVNARFSTSTTCTATSTTFAAPAACAALACTGTQTGGTVFNDYDADGIKDVNEVNGLAGVAVNAYNCTGTLVGTATTDVDGKYTFSSLIAANYPIRVEFSGLTTTYAQGTPNGTNGRTTTQFVNAASCSINLGVLDANDYCQANPKIIVPCYVEGNPLGGTAAGAEDAVVGFNYTTSGLKNAASMTVIASAAQVGSTWGTAYNKFTKKLFMSATLKRHAGLGPLGLGGIYVSNLATVTTPVTSSWLDVTTLGINVGSIPTNSARGLLGTIGQPSGDSLAYINTGKVGIGGLDLSSDGNKLYFTNLFDNKLYEIDITAYNTSGTLPTSTNVKSYDMSTNITCTGGSLHIWAVKVYKGKVYTGMVCDAGTSQNKSDLRAYIQELNGTTVSTVFDFPLTYPKGYAIDAYANIVGWFPWSDNWNAKTQSTFYNNSFGTPVQFVIHQEPIFSSIEFDSDGSMILAFADRTGLQTGFENFRPNGTGAFAGFSGGDILRASVIGNSYILENNAKSESLTGTGASNNQGPGFGEFYDDDYAGDVFNRGSLVLYHSEIMLGGLALKPGSGEVIAVTFDPLDIPLGITNSNGAKNYYNAGGIRHLNNTTGITNSAYIVYNSNTDVGTFGKAAGLGDAVLTCAAPTYLQIGNYVWLDIDKDGVQDPCESPLSNITVSLWKGGTQIASTTTNSSGEYYFSSKYLLGAAWTGTGADTTLLPNTAYEVRILMSQSGITTPNYQLTTANSTANSGNDQNDSDAAISGGYAVIAFTTGSAGSVNHTYDFGFGSCPTITNPSATQTVCVGATGSNITVNTSYNTANGIRFVKFTTDQSATNGSETATEKTNIYAGTALSTVTPTGASSPYTATYTFNAADFPNATSANITYYVYAILNPDLGASCRPVQEIQITIKPTPSVTAPANQTVCNGASTTAITFAGSAVTGTTYSWTNNTTSIGLAASGTGNIAAFTATNATSTPVTATITVTPTANSCAGTAKTFTITVNPTPSVTKPVDQVICKGSSTSAITFTGGISGTTYAWTNNTTSIGLAASGSGNITAFTGLNTTTSPVVATITVTPTLNSCVGTAKTFTITVNPKPTLTLGSSSCQSNLIKYDVPFTATGGTVTTNQGTISGGSVIDVPIASSVTITVTNATTGCSYSQTVNPPNCSCPTVNAPTTAVDADKTICQGETIPALTASAGASETIDWYDALSGGTLLLANSTTYTPTAAGTFYAEARNTTSGCVSAMRSDVSLTINAIPSVSAPSNQSICNGLSTMAVMFTGSAISGTIYNWTNDNATIGLAASGSGDIASFTATNSGSSPVVATINVTPIANTCSGLTESFTITVNPQPTTPSVSSPIMNVCPLTTANLTTISSALTPSVSGGVFGWHVSNSSSSAMVSNQNMVVAGDYYLFERSPAGCYSTGLKVTVAIQVCCPPKICLPVTVARSN